MRLLIIILFISCSTFAQDIPHQWEFKKAGTDKWYAAVVPGSIYTDLFRNKLIQDPFFSNNETKLQWIDTCDWIYRTTFNYRQFRYRHSMRIELQGLDTYADIYVNGKLIEKTDNMFRAYSIDALRYATSGTNELMIYFHSAKKITDSIAKARLPLVLPDNNRVYARKAQFQFGWDWGPKFIGCGIWRPVRFTQQNPMIPFVDDLAAPVAKLVRKKDSIGESFYFEKDGKPVYAKGANWIPANIFLPTAKQDYRKLLHRVKDANMNMLRVWGGGIYEDDYFYELCDSLGIMVWQDFMFAGGMYPADEAFLKNVKEEVRYQVERLKVHPCIVLWCGNNEIDEAWHNWGWQGQFNLHGADSAKVWANYKTLFEDSLKAWVNEFDGQRPYISSSPKYGWGNKKSFTEGDSHYWGLWWGLEPWEKFNTHTGRFVSEYGMQSMPDYETVKTYVPANDLRYNSVAVQSHQKAGEGFKKLNFYIDKYFLDSAKLKKLSLKEYAYLTQCLQYYILKNSIAVHRSKEPQNMGTLLWQMNDCWPVTSWSITNYDRSPKAAWYAVKNGYRDDLKPETDKIYPKELKLSKPKFIIRHEGESSFSIMSDTDAKFVSITLLTGTDGLSDNFFDLKAGEKKYLSVQNRYFTSKEISSIKTISLYDVLNKK